MTDALRQHAEHSIAHGSKSFAAASRLFAPRERRSAVMLYAWCRHCDDVVDGQVLGFTASTEQVLTPAQRLEQLYSATRAAYAGERMSEPAFAAFQAVALEHDIPQRYAFDHLAGFAMDARGEHYQTFDDTLRYCYHVAGVVGLMMAHVMGVRDEATLDRACDLGLAFQLTNIARDIVEDAHMGRCYIPARWLSEHDLSRDNLVSVDNRQTLAHIAQRLVDNAEPYYRSSRAGVSELPWRSALAVTTAHQVYRAIGMRVKARGANAWEQRVSTSKVEKLGQLATAAVVTLGSRGRRWPPRDQGLWQRPR